MLKQLEHYPEYAVTDAGDVYRVSMKGKQITPRKRKSVNTSDGYKRIMLSCSGVKYQPRVHVLVLQAFKGDAPEGHEAAHLNGIRDDNRIENLAWVTRKENHSHKWLHGTQQAGEQASTVKLTSDKVTCIRSRKARGENAKALASEYGVTESVIHRIVKRRLWNHV